MAFREKNYTLDDAVLDFNGRNETLFKQKFTDNQDIMSKCVFTEDWERRKQLPEKMLARSSSKKAKVRQEKLSEDIARNVEVLKMRSVLDPKRFYKRDKTISVTRNVQMGRVIDSAADFYHSRLPKKQRKSNLVEELLADAEFKQYNKRRFLQIIDSKKKLSRNLRRYKSLIDRSKGKKKKTKNKK